MKDITLELKDLWDTIYKTQNLFFKLAGFLQEKGGACFSFENIEEIQENIHWLAKYQYQPVTFSNESYHDYIASLNNKQLSFTKTRGAYSAIETYPPFLIHLPVAYHVQVEKYEDIFTSIFLDKDKQTFTGYYLDEVTVANLVNTNLPSYQLLLQATPHDALTIPTYTHPIEQNFFRILGYLGNDGKDDGGNVILENNPSPNLLDTTD